MLVDLGTRQIDTDVGRIAEDDPDEQALSSVLLVVGAKSSREGWLGESGPLGDLSQRGGDYLLEGGGRVRGVTLQVGVFARGG